MRNGTCRASMAFVLCVTASQAIADSEIKIELRSNRMSEIDVGKAVEVFRGACRPLGGYYWQNLEEITATAFDEYAPHRLAKGWKTTIHLSGRKSDGDTVHYHIRVGTSSGF